MENSVRCDAQLDAADLTAEQRLELSPRRVCEPWVDEICKSSRVAATDKLSQAVLSPLRGSDLIMHEYPRLADSPWAGSHRCSAARELCAVTCERKEFAWMCREAPFNGAFFWRRLMDPGVN